MGVTLPLSFQLVDAAVEHEPAPGHMEEWYPAKLVRTRLPMLLVVLGDDASLPPLRIVMYVEDPIESLRPTPRWRPVNFQL